MSMNANEIAQEYARRERLSIQPPNGANPGPRTGRLTIQNMAGSVVESTAPCYLRIMDGLLVTEFPDGQKAIYRMAEGWSAHFEPVREGE